MKNNVFSKHNLIFKMALVAVFSALCFVVMLLPKIPVPSLVGNPYIHFGNLVVILVAILFGGWIGGLSGAIGMGIYDIISGYGIWTIKTIILKFGIGIVTGLVYQLIRNRDDKHLKREMIYVGSFFTILGLFTAVLALITGGQLVLSDKTISIPWILYCSSLCLGIILILSGVIAKVNNSQKAIYAASFGVLFNVFGELLGGFIKKMLQGNGFRSSLAMTIVSIPATIINGCVAVLVVAIVFPAINKAMSKIRTEEPLENSKE